MKTSMEKARRKAVVFIWGYGGDVVILLCAIGGAIVAGGRSFFDIDYAREILRYH